MNLGYPVHTDPYELDPTSVQTTQGMRPKTLLSDKLLTEKLLAEARNIMPEFFIKDPSSSDDSTDDYDYPETMSEQVRGLSFARRRRLHYNEFATVPLARRLIREEFASETSSVKSEDSAFLMQEPEEECPPCEPGSDDSYPYFQYERSTNASQGSDDSGPKEDPEPGFDPKHPCYQKLTGIQPTIPVSVSTLAFEIAPSVAQELFQVVENDDVPAAPSPEPENKPKTPGISAIAAVNKDLQESLEKDLAKTELQQAAMRPSQSQRRSLKQAGFRSV